MCLNFLDTIKFFGVLNVFKDSELTASGWWLEDKKFPDIHSQSWNWLTDKKIPDIHSQSWNWFTDKKLPGIHSQSWNLLTDKKLPDIHITQPKLKLIDRQEVTWHTQSKLKLVDNLLCLSSLLKLKKIIKMRWGQLLTYSKFKLQAAWWWTIIFSQTLVNRGAAVFQFLPTSVF